MSKCAYDVAWIGRCGREAAEGETCCEKHRGVKCASCGAPATRECDHTGQFVCGFPLCNDCEGWTDVTKPSGSWGFMNHSHRKKAPHPMTARRHDILARLPVVFGLSERNRYVH